MKRILTILINVILAFFCLYVLLTHTNQLEVVAVCAIGIADCAWDAWQGFVS